MARMFKVILQGVPQEGTYTAEECGTKTEALLNLMGSAKIEFVAVYEEDVEATEEFGYDPNKQILLG